MSDLLHTKMCGLEFKNPLMAGCAGITETAKLCEKWLKAGAGGVLVKSITTDPNLRTYIRPTFYSLNQQGLKGAMTEGELLNHIPPERFVETEGVKIAELCKRHEAVYIQSIVGQGTDYDDWAYLARLAEQGGAQAIELDLCCPLAPGNSAAYSSIDLGEDPLITALLVSAVKKAVSVPVGVKLSPTIKSLDKVGLAAQAAGANFASAVNAPPGFSIDIDREEIVGPNTYVGYIPGPSLKWWGLWKVTQVGSACKDLEISGVGGIFTAKDAIEYILCGCPTVQIVSSVYYKGPKVFEEILSGISDFMRNKGYTSIEDFRGKVLRQLITYKDVPKEEVIAEPSDVIATVDIEKCNGCGICAVSCIHDAISIDDVKKVCQINNDCFGCGFCAGVCPQNAIHMVHKQSKKTIWLGQGAMETEWVNW